MQTVDGAILLSATDAANHLGCRHLTRLDLGAARGDLVPPRHRDPALAILEQRGLAFEAKYLEHLQSRGLDVVRCDAADVEGATASGRLRVAMQTGAAAIVQAPLQSPPWRGRADVLLRVSRPSDLGAWSYEAVDTKLSRETRAGAILQLCLYSELLAGLQGVLPEAMHVVVPGNDFAPRSYRVRDYRAYFGWMQRRLVEAVDPRTTDGTYPEPVPQCDICRWWPECDRRRRADDHLAFVAGISRMQRREVRGWGVTTLAGLAALPLPIAHKPRHGAVASYERVREQARVQFQGREQASPVYELLPRNPGEGLARLPEPTAADLFFDIEGDPFVDGGGIEYLIGAATCRDEYAAVWAQDAATERAAFTTFIGRVLEAWAQCPSLHVYHYSPYDPAALKRLMGRYGVLGPEIDRMLRGGLFVDLHAIVRQALRASVEEYSIKKLEPFYGYERAVDLDDARAHRRAIEHALELGMPEAIGDDTRRIVEGYNRDDCISAARLRDWLEELRAEIVARGEPIARPPLAPDEPADNVAAKDQRARQLVEALVRDIPADLTVRTREQQSTWLLAQLVEYHRREEKVAWWEYFRMCDLRDDEFIDEKGALGELVFAEDLGPIKRSRLHRYRFPRQSTDVRRGHTLRTPDGHEFGTVHAIDFAAGTVDVKKSNKRLDEHPTAVFEFAKPSIDVLSEAVVRLGEWVAENGIDSPAPQFRAERDLLLRNGPRLRPGALGLAAGAESATDTARRLAMELDRGVLAVQGPPGTGKTYNGARMILELVRAGRRVGVTAVSHKVIRNLLCEVVAAQSSGEAWARCAHKDKDKDEAAGESTDGIRHLDSNESALAALQDGTANVVGGTQWLWARPEFAAAVDVLFVDEAGQMSLANVLAAAQGARSVVLLGDPQQLEQPQKGSHPEGADVSALEYLVGVDGRKTIDPERGLFLGETWRLHPAICAYTSELFYEGRLLPRAGLERQALVGPTRFAGAGLWFEPVEHEGNRGSSAEEVERVRAIVAELQRDGVGWTDDTGAVRALALEDILVVAPYNAQVADLSAALPPGARVGTVDRFQGQQAPVVIYSLATSSAEDAPRGMEFLYSLNRLNVATSRARCAAILVANPRLFEPECRTPAQMRLANAFCRYREVAR